MIVEQFENICKAFKKKLRSYRFLSFENRTSHVALPTKIFLTWSVIITNGQWHCNFVIVNYNYLSLFERLFVLGEFANSICMQKLVKIVIPKLLLLCPTVGCSWLSIINRNFSSSATYTSKWFCEDGISKLWQNKWTWKIMSDSEALIQSCNKRPSMNKENNQ